MVDKDHYLLTHPKKQKFYRNLGMMLNILGIGDQTWWGYNPPNLFVKIWNRLVFPVATLCFLSELLYMVVDKDRLTLEKLGVIFAVLPVTCLILVNLISANSQIYCVLMKNFMDNNHMFNLNEEKHGSYFLEIRIKIERYTRYVCYLLIGFIASDFLSWTVIPIAYNVINREAIQNHSKTIQVYLYFVMPFEYDYSVQNWAIVHLIEVFVAGIGCAIFAVFSSLNHVFVFQLIGHIEMLKAKVQYNFSEISKDENMSRKIIEIIKYHTFIISFFNDIQSTFGLNITATYIQNLIGDSILLFEVMFGEKGHLFTHGLMFGVNMGGLIMMSFALEEIKTQSDDLGDIVYSVPWEDMSERDRKTFLIFLARAQKPLEFIGAGGLRAGIEPMIAIMKSTFSYYVMLKTFIK